MTLLFLQEVADTLQLAQEGLMSATPKDSVSVFELILRGGFTMAILGVLSVVSIYVFVERWMTIKRAQGEPALLLDKVRSAVVKGDIGLATSVCQQNSTPMARMLVTGLSHIGSTLKNIEAAVENVGKIEIYKLEKNLSILGTISGAAPMIGFFGTVIGMIKAFIAISQEEGSVSPKLLSAGIYEAMITTAGGLFVGILAYVCYNYLVRQVSEVVHKMEVTSIEFIDLLQKPN